MNFIYYQAKSGAFLEFMQNSTWCMYIMASEEQIRWLSGRLLNIMGSTVVITCSNMFDITGANSGSCTEQVRKKNEVLILVRKESDQNRKLPSGKLHAIKYALVHITLASSFHLKNFIGNKSNTLFVVVFIIY